MAYGLGFKVLGCFRMFRVIGFRMICAMTNRSFWEY